MFGFRDSRGEWLPALLAAVAFAASVAAFAYELLTYQRMVTAWARSDIDSRAHLAAASLAEPLRKEDFAAVRRVGDECEADGVHLLVTSSRGGVVYASKVRGGGDSTFSSERCPSGECVVTVEVPMERVLAPFRRAIRGFILAGVAGVAGVLLFFFVTYRQRVRIRELKRLEKFRRDFIADVSHEIKTPLTGILGAVDLMESCGGAKADVLVSLVKKESIRLNGLVQSILDLARLEREGEILDRAETDLAALARTVAERCGVAFSDGGADRPCVAACDARLIERALVNLVENAKRHSGSTEIAVSVAQADGLATLTVEDHGIGIPPEESERIFERFHRIDPARAAETGGAGLGLAIVRRIARLHGGDVTVSSAKPHGAVFVLKIPAERGGRVG